MLFGKDTTLRSYQKPQGKYNNVVTVTASASLIHQHNTSNISHPHCIHQVRESEVLMAKNSPTVPDREVDVVPGKDVVELSLLCFVFSHLSSVRDSDKMYTCSYLMSVRLTGAGSVSTTTGMAKLKKQFLKDSNPYPPTTLINSRAT